MQNIKSKRDVLVFFLLCVCCFTYAQTKVSDLQRNAENGDTQAQYLLGMMYLYGDKVTKDTKTGYNWLQKSAEAGNVNAQCNWGCIANMYKAYNDAYKWFHKAADQNDYYGCINLATCYFEGKGTNVNLDQAKYWYEKALTISPQNLANYRMTLNVSIEEELDKIRAAKSCGTMDVYNDIEQCWNLSHSNDQQQSFTSFIRLLEYAQKGIGLAEGYVGSCYLNGCGTKASIKDAVYWTQKGADHDDTFSAAEMGIYYVEGLGVEKNIEESIRLEKIAARRGQSHACYILGTLYENTNKDEMIKWYRKACDLHHGAAFQNLGFYYKESGQPKKAFDLYKEAIELEEGGLLTNIVLPGTFYNSIGLFYFDGTPPVSKDLEKAKEYFQKAAAKGHVKGSMNLQEVLNELKNRK